MHKAYNNIIFIFSVLALTSLCLVFLQHHNELQSFLKLNPSEKLHIDPYIAVIIDDRATEALINAVLNVLQHIPSDWKVQVFTHPEIWPFYQTSSLGPFIRSNRIFMTPLPFSKNRRPAGEYVNLLLTSVDLWRKIRGEKVLYFQIDSVICSNSSYKLSEFLNYDFVGAPWAVGGCCNGGFSIRSRSKTLRLLEHGVYRYRLNTINEDGWFTQHLPYYNATIAPTEVAKKFSVETVYHQGSFAVHKPLISYLGEANMKRLCEECPETRRISKDC